VLEFCRGSTAGFACQSSVYLNQISDYLNLEKIKDIVTRRRRS
jgi:hypothetical protein